MSTELIINASLPETRIALMENGEIQELLIERASGKGIVGNIYKGRVTRVLPGMQAAFVDIGLEKAAFLYVDDVYVHSEIWEEEEGPEAARSVISEVSGSHEAAPATATEAGSAVIVQGAGAAASAGSEEASGGSAPGLSASDEAEVDAHLESDFAGDEVDEDDEPEDLDEEDEEDDQGPVGMGPGPDGGDDGNSGSRAEQPSGTVRPEQPREGGEQRSAEGGSGSSEGGQDQGQVAAAGGEGQGGEGQNGRRRRRGRRGGRFRRGRDRDGGKEGKEVQQVRGPSVSGANPESYPENYHEHVEDEGDVESDRSAMSEGRESAPADAPVSEEAAVGRPDTADSREEPSEQRRPSVNKQDFKAQRSKDRRIPAKQTARPVRAQVNIQDLLKEGQEVLVQVAKDPIATKGARLTCHISLPGRHLVCMPTIDHVGVSRRIERDDERRRLRDFVERNRPKNLGFIVRTASGRQQSEKRIKQDIDYLTRLWNEIREKAANVTAPALVYEDLNSVLRAIRDWVTEDIDKIIVDSRYHYNEMQRFVSHFMPSLKQKVELYHGDIPIFDAYNISTELSRALERKVWLKSGGYIVVDQAEALVAIDVNTGRYVGKKNLEDTILKTNLEAVQEIAYQLRLRNCGGIIILDLIDMEKEENKQRVYRALEEALKKDRARPSILKISELGLVEMTRKRTRDTMVRALCESCAHCEGKGFIKSKQTVGYEALREIEREGIEKDIGKILVQAHPDVIDILAIDERETLDQLERRYRKQVYLQAVPDFHPEQFEVIGDKKDKSELSARDQQQNQRRDQRGEERGGRRGGRDRDRGRDRNRDRNRDQQRGQQRQQRQQQVVQVGDSGEGAGAEGQSMSGIEAHPLPIMTGAGGDMSVTQSLAPRDDFDSEEDRLAFLRAQAAQDAALARMGGAGAGEQQTPGRGGPNRGGDRGGERGAGPGEGGGRGGRRGRRGRRGGKFRGGRRFEQGANAPKGGGEGGGGGEGPSGGGEGGAGAGGGGGDHSQPTS